MLNGKRVLSMVLALIMVCANLPWTAVATELAEATVATEVTQNAEATQPDETTQSTETTAPVEELKKEEAAVTDVPAATGASSNEYIYEVTMRVPEYRVGDAIPAAKDIDVEINVEGVEVVEVSDFYIFGKDEDVGEIFGNKCYRIWVDIQAPAGKQFSENIEIFGDNIAWWEFYNDGILTVYFDYDFQLPRVERIYVYGLPDGIQAGEAQIPESLAIEGNAQITAVRWVNDRREAVSAFVDDNDYYLELTLVPEEGYSFRNYLDCKNSITYAYIEADVVDENTAKVYFGYSLKPDAGPFTINIDGVYVGADVTAYNITVDV